MSKVLFTVAVPHTGQSRRPSFVISTNNLNAVQISKKGVNLGNTNYNGGFKRFEYSVGGNQAVTKFSLVVNTSALLPHITWATGLPLPIIKKKKKKDKRSSSADATSRRPQRPQMGRRASSMDRIEASHRRKERIEGRRRGHDDYEREMWRITDGSERRPPRLYKNEDRKEGRSSRYSGDDDYSTCNGGRREDRRSGRFYVDDNNKYPRRSLPGNDDKQNGYSSFRRSEIKPRLSHSTRYGDLRLYDRYKDRLAPLSEVDAYERKYGKDARRRRYKRQEKYDGGEIVDDGPDGLDADDDGGLGDDGDVGDAGDAGGDGGD